MKIQERGYVKREIGEFDMVRRFPIAARHKLGMKTICGVCRKSITEDFNLVGFKKGLHNILMHEGCYDGNTTIS